MPAVSTILRAAAGEDVARVIVVTSSGAAPDELLHGARDVGAEIVVTGDLLWAFSDAALAGRLEAIRSAWGLANVGRTVIIGVEPVNERDWREMEEAKAAFLPEAALLRWAGASRQQEASGSLGEQVSGDTRTRRAGDSNSGLCTRNFPALGTQHSALSTQESEHPTQHALLDTPRAIPDPVPAAPPDLRQTCEPVVADPEAIIPREQEDADDERPTLTREELAMLLGPLDEGGADTTLPAVARSGGGT